MAIDSNLGGKCLIAGGDIVSTQIAAKKGILAKNIGTEASKPGTIEVGNDYRFERAVRGNTSKMAEYGKLDRTITSQIERLKEHSAQINTELGAGRGQNIGPDIFRDHRQGPPHPYRHL